MKKFGRILPLTLIAALLAGCAKEMDPVESGESQENVVVTLTTSVSIGESESRAVSGLGVKTFAVGDQIAVVYTNTGDATVKAESLPLTASDISDDGKSADFRVSLTNPKTGDVTYVYPASMVNADGTEASFAAQPGTLAGLQGFDYAKVKIEDGLTVNGSEVSLPADASLENQLAVCKFWLKDNSGAANLSGITSVTIYNGGNGGDIYTISQPSAITWPIYVAMKPTTSAISFKATDGTNNYWKLVSGATLAAGGVYTIDVKMGVPGALPGQFSVSATEKVYFSQGNLQYMGAAETRYWKFAEDQLTYLGSTSTNNSPSETYVNRDLFGWGTRDNPCYLSFQSNNYNWLEWGENVISNGGNAENVGWYTLPDDGWDYMLSLSSGGRQGDRFVKATVGGVCGLIIFPDGWAGNRPFASKNTENVSFSSNSVTLPDWGKNLEPYGAVFLPAAGYRGGSSISSVGVEGGYWSYIQGTNPAPAWIKIKSDNLDVVDSEINKSVGRSVRLVIPTTATTPAPTTAPVGAHPVQFNVGKSGESDKWVYFASGNLQYIGSAPTPYLKFADSQYETIGPRQSYGEHVNMDLFGWGTADQPYKSSTNNGVYSTYNDWNSSTIYSGATPTTGWRTLSKDEWTNLFSHYSHFGVAIIPGGYEGLIIDPTNTMTLNQTSVNTLTEEQWADAKAKGCLFLPKTGRRAGVNNDYTDRGLYWTTTQHSTNSGSGYYLSFVSSVLINSSEKHYGLAVRLVKDVE